MYAQGPEWRRIVASVLLAVLLTLVGELLVMLLIAVKVLTILTHR